MRRDAALPESGDRDLYSNNRLEFSRILSDGGGNYMNLEQCRSYFEPKSPLEVGRRRIRYERHFFTVNRGSYKGTCPTITA